MPCKAQGAFTTRVHAFEYSCIQSCRFGHTRVGTLVPPDYTPYKTHPHWNSYMRDPPTQGPISSWFMGSLIHPSVGSQLGHMADKLQISDHKITAVTRWESVLLDHYRHLHYRPAIGDGLDVMYSIGHQTTMTRFRITYDMVSHLIFSLSVYVEQHFF